MEDKQSSFFEFCDEDGGFRSVAAGHMRTVYFPLAGVDALGIKSAVTPFLAGDAKIDKEHYLTRPVSVEDLRWGGRDVFLYLNPESVLSVNARDPATEATVEAGQLWHKVLVNFRDAGVAVEILNVIPVDGTRCEWMQVTVRNENDTPLEVTPTISVPLFGRALANKHDHEHVTSLLHRIVQVSRGVLLEPVMRFDEEGHQAVSDVYYVLGQTGDGEAPEGTFPTMDIFCSSGSHLLRPEAVWRNHAPQSWPEPALQGQEAVGALRFAATSLAPGSAKSYLLVCGMAASRPEAEEVLAAGATSDRIQQVVTDNQTFWRQKSGALQFYARDAWFHRWMRWVTLQPVLRRIFGCSFLPDHDYGKGGKGWRDIWQDLLSLILIEPAEVRESLVYNFAGVRIDGSNATIIGSRKGEFLADRNAISRVWMDHGVWPFLTLLLYIHQSGDFAVLEDEMPYFRDSHQSRTKQRDTAWSPSYGRQLKTSEGKVYRGTVLEHLLVQHLVQFFNVGAHNLIRLESADWNDGLDMAFERGESATFSALYAGNLKEMADLLMQWQRQTGRKEMVVARELLLLMDSLGSEPCPYDNVQRKQALLFDVYFAAVQPEVSGEQVTVKIADVAVDLRQKGEWLLAHIREQEKVTATDGERTFAWFNGYYDNDGRRVEGEHNGRVRMTLTGQVFPLMGGVAQDEDVTAVTSAVNHFLQDTALGGIRLNTDFGVPHYLALGRAFGFAYGTKENGSFFSHMTVMYAYALYKCGRARDGYRVIDAIVRMCRDARSDMYPNIPEYFDNSGRGRYTYLTGSASWLVLTLLTRVFGVRGDYGDLLLAPQLVPEEFDERGEACVICSFAGKKLQVTYDNPDRLSPEEWVIPSVELNGTSLDVPPHSRAVRIPRATIRQAGDAISLRVRLQAAARSEK